MDELATKKVETEPELVPMLAGGGGGGGGGGSAPQSNPVRFPLMV